MHYVLLGGDDHEHGVGILLNKTVANSVVGFWPVSDRIALVKLKAKPFNINIIQVYASTSSSTEEGLEWFKEHDQIIMDTWFTKHPRKLWTWKSLDGITGNQINYSTVNRRYRNTDRDIRTLPEADCNSHHNMLVGNIKVRLQRLKSHKFTSPKLDLKSLEKEKEVKEKFYKEVETTMETINENQSAEQLVKVFQTSLKEAAQTSIPVCPKKKHKPWIIPEILELMKERRKVKNKITAYKKLDREG